MTPNHVVSAVLNLGSYLLASKIFTVGQLQPKMYIIDLGTSVTVRQYIAFANPYLTVFQDLPFQTANIPNDFIPLPCHFVKVFPCFRNCCPHALKKSLFLKCLKLINNVSS